MRRILLEQSLFLPVPGLDKLPLAVKVAAIEETPTIETIGPGVDPPHDQFRVFQHGDVTAWAGVVGAPAVGHRAELRHEEWLAILVRPGCPVGCRLVETGHSAITEPIEVLVIGMEIIGPQQIAGSRTASVPAAARRR